MTTYFTEKVSELISHFGSQHKLAKALGCTQPSVWAWAQGKAAMSAKHAIKAEKITNGEFKASELCPDLAELESTE